MSRCFPYSPLKREEPLIESIKLQKEKENAKKKEKKEKRKDKKENKENVNKDTGNSQEKKHRHKKRKHKDISPFQQKDDGSTKASNNNAIDQLERSSLTEEHGTPIQNSESSEGSPDSNKKRKLATSVNHSSNGTILRIKLHLPILQQKNMDLSPLPRGEQGKAEPGHENLGPPPLSRVEQEIAEPIGRMPKHEQHDRRASSEQACYSGRLIKTTPGKEELKSRHCSSRSEHRASCSKEMKRFSELVMNWDALKMQFEYTDASDQEWLFGAPKRDSNTCTTKVNKVGDDLAVPSSSASSSSQPRASYVPDFDMYQLPYVIPF